MVVTEREVDILERRDLACGDVIPAYARSSNNVRHSSSVRPDPRWSADSARYTLPADMKFPVSHYEMFFD